MVRGDGAWAALLVLTVSRCAASPAAFRADLDGRGAAERVVLDPSSARCLRIERNGRLIASAVPRGWRPWKLALSDVDGDGRTEIVVAVRKSTPMWRRPHNCLFVYWFDGQRIRPRWLGSRLSRPFVDFAIGRGRRGGAAALAAVELDGQGRRSVALYAWNGFGYTLVERRGAWRSVSKLRVRGRWAFAAADGRSVKIGR